MRGWAKIWKRGDRDVYSAPSPSFGIPSTFLSPEPFFVAPSRLFCHHEPFFCRPEPPFHVTPRRQPRGLPENAVPNEARGPSALWASGGHDGRLSPRAPFLSPRPPFHVTPRRQPRGLQQFLPAFNKPYLFLCKVI